MAKNKSGLKVFLVLLIGIALFAGFIFLLLNIDVSKSDKEKIDNIKTINASLTNLINDNASDTTIINVSNSKLNNGYISIQDFCSLTKASISSSNYLTLNGFTFYLETDGQVVKSNGTVKLDAVASALGYEVLEDADSVSLSRVFATKRIIANTTKDLNEYDAKTTLTYKNYQILQFDSELKTKNAFYDMLDAGLNVQLDQYVISNEVQNFKASAQSVNGCSTFDGEMMGLNDYLNYLNNQTGEKEEVLVAVVDTGIYAKHELFAGRIATDYAMGFYDSEDNWVDDNGHGSHISGTIVNWTPSNVKILPIKFLGGDEGVGLVSKLLLITDYLNSLIEQGVNIRVFNGSFGLTSALSTNWNKYSSITQSFQDLVKKGVAVCIAAGNNNISTDYEYPAVISEVVTVASISNQKEKSSFSNYGNIDFSAPGENISSAGIAGPKSYVVFDGTSMATAHISAAYALLFSNASQKYTFQQVDNLLKLRSTVDLGVQGYDEKFGYGYIDLTKLLNLNSTSEEKEYKIVTKFIIDDQTQISNDVGTLVVSYINNLVEKSFQSTSFDLSEVQTISTGFDLQLDCNLKMPYSFVGWFVGTNQNLGNESLFSTSKNFELKLSRLSTTQTNYIYAKIKVETADLTINLIYKDVEQYTGFASFETKITIWYVDLNRETIVLPDYVSGIDATDQIIKVKVPMGVTLRIVFTCENDSVVNYVYSNQSGICDSSLNGTFTFRENMRDSQEHLIVASILR